MRILIFILLMLCIALTGWHMIQGSVLLNQVHYERGMITSGEFVVYLLRDILAFIVVCFFAIVGFFKMSLDFL